MIPSRISIVSYNLWNVERWPDREPALSKFLTNFNPDILCIQELRSETRQCILENLLSHDHVQDALPGWTCESNIFWNRNYFEEVAHGLEFLDMREKERGFFWVRLKVKGTERSLFVSTAHFTWQGNPEEFESGLTPRNKQVRQTLKHLERLVHKDEAAFFMGDLNDPAIPTLFFPKAGYHSCYSDLNLLPPPTYPAVPTTSDLRQNQTIDWIFSNGRAKPLSASSPQVFCNGLGASDHWPVHAVYEV